MVWNTYAEMLGFCSEMNLFEWNFFNGLSFLAFLRLEGDMRPLFSVISGLMLWDLPLKPAPTLSRLGSLCPPLIRYDESPPCSSVADCSISICLREVGTTLFDEIDWFLNAAAIDCLRFWP